MIVLVLYTILLNLSWIKKMTILEEYGAFDIYNIMILESKEPLLHSRSVVRIFTGRNLDRQGCKVSSCGQRRLWSDCANAQSDLSLRWAYIFRRYVSWRRGAYFSKKKGFTFHANCLLGRQLDMFSKETICMKYEILLSWKISKENLSKRRQFPAVSFTYGFRVTGRYYI